MNKSNMLTISFRIEKDNASIFSPILQQGFMLSAQIGCSFKNLLCNQFGVNPEYLSNRIKTIFFNGKPVDDVETTIITDGAVLALSAAMPGLVGATFRSGGALSIFRSSISHRNETNKSKAPAQGMVTLKLFNLLISEMGPAFLEKGVWVKREIIKDFIAEKEIHQLSVFKSIHVDGKEIKLDKINQLLRDGSPKNIFIIVQTDE